MNKKIIGISLFILIITSSIFGCSKFQENNDTNLNSIDKDSINPISKDTAINILKAEYGDNILVEDKDIKLIGDLYFIDSSLLCLTRNVYINIDSYLLI